MAYLFSVLLELLVVHVFLIFAHGLHNDGTDQLLQVLLPQHFPLFLAHAKFLLLLSRLLLLDQLRFLICFRQLPRLLLSLLESCCCRRSSSSSDDCLDGLFSRWLWRPRLKRCFKINLPPRPVTGLSGSGGGKPVNCRFFEFKEFGSFVRSVFLGWRRGRFSNRFVIDTLES